MESLEFKGSGWEYFKIWIVNILLVIITLGLYFPWAKVRNRRYFYGNTVLNNRNFEYHATGRQMLPGYLLALAAFILFTSIQQILPYLAGVFFFALFVLMPWVIWRSLMFNLKMSSFSNIRFQFTGKLGKAYINYFYLPIVLFFALYGVPVLILSVLILQGLTHPVVLVVGSLLYMVMIVHIKALMSEKNAHYLFDNYRYGQGQFQTTVDRKGFAHIFMKTLLLGPLLSILVIAVTIITLTVINPELLTAISALELEQGDPKAMEQVLKEVGPPLGIFIYGLFLLISIAVAAFFISRKREYIYRNTTLDGVVKFESILTARRLFFVMTSNLLLLILSLGLAMPWVKVRMARLMTQTILVNAQDNWDRYIDQQQKQQSALADQLGDTFDADLDMGF